MSYHFDENEEHERKVRYIEGELGKGTRHPDDVKLLREQLHRLTTGVKKFFGRKPSPVYRETTTPAVKSTPVKPKPSRAEEIAAQMAEAGRRAVEKNGGGDA